MWITQLDIRAGIFRFNLFFLSFFSSHSVVSRLDISIAHYIFQSDDVSSSLPLGLREFGNRHTFSLFFLRLCSDRDDQRSTIECYHESIVGLSS